MRRLLPILLPCCVLVAQNAYQPRVDLDAGRYLKALWDAEARLSANGNDALAWAAKSQALAALVRLDEAGRAADRAVQLQPGLADALLARGMVRAGQAIQQRSLGSFGLVRSALKDLKDAVQADSTLVSGWFALGMAYQQLPGILGGSIKKALQCADQLRRVNGPRGDLLAGTILTNEKKFGEAEPYLRRAIAGGWNDGQVVYGYLEVLGSRETREHLGEEGQNRRLATEAARLLPLVKGKARALQAVSDAFLDADQPEQAWKVAKEGLPGCDALSLLRFQMGKVAARAGIHREEGLAALDACLKESLEGGVGGYQNVHWRRAQVLNALGRTQEARGAAQEALRIDSNHPGVRRFLKELGEIGAA